MDRDKFVTELKARALEIARAGDLVNAVSVVAAEVNRRPDTKIHHAVVLAGHMKALDDDKRGVLAWIESIQ